MKSIEFKGSVAANGQIQVPSQIMQQLPRGEELQIVVLWGSSSSDDAWEALARERFEAAYAPQDSVYEQLLDGPTT